MLYRIVALQNQGKGILASYLLLLDYLRGKTIYSNSYLAIPHIRINKDWFIQLAQQKEETNIRDCSFFLDEFWVWCDSRDSQKKDNKLASYALLQSSKMNWNIYTTCQTENQDDSRLRNNAHFRTECKRVFKDVLGYHNIISEERILPDNVNEYLYIECKREKLTPSGLINLPKMYLKAKPLFKLYDTIERKYAQSKEKVITI